MVITTASFGGSAAVAASIGGGTRDEARNRKRRGIGKRGELIPWRAGEWKVETPLHAMKSNVGRTKHTRLPGFAFKSRHGVMGKFRPSEPAWGHRHEAMWRLGRTPGADSFL